MTTILNTLAPVFLVILLGYGLKRRGFLSAQALADINRLTYWIGLPCLLVYKLATAEPAFGQIGGLLVMVTGTTMAGMGLAWWSAARLGVAPGATGTFVQASFRGNLTFIGLPVVIYAFPASDAAQATALLVFGPVVVFYNVASVMVLLLSQVRRETHILPRLLQGLYSNPILIACILGVSWSLAGPPMPLMLQRSLAALGQMALPLALLCIGGSLASVKLRGRIRPALAAACCKTLLIPVGGYGLARMMGLDDAATRLGLILLACPTASASYVLVRHLGGDEALAAGAILLSTLLAAPALAVVLAL